ncbi:hypothetical protein CPC08DRAFT_758253 [Agrocybe pediades]|nr:hypothetical protein CPC08DRAFT_758253 [Agrocybe pediades]
MLFQYPDTYPMPAYYAVPPGALLPLSHAHVPPQNPAKAQELKNLVTLYAIQEAIKICYNDLLTAYRQAHHARHISVHPAAYHVNPNVIVHMGPGYSTSAWWLNQDRRFQSAMMSRTISENDFLHRLDLLYAILEEHTSGTVKHLLQMVSRAHQRYHRNGSLAELDTLCKTVLREFQRAIDALRGAEESRMLYGELLLQGPPEDWRRS